ncbi:hypothetical protein ACFV7R_14205 [Streptomyces sp. NPDC059866]|uniref:hypothetical protein n=1 Tax=Streptomyces sp. NPDC059866 TaxID=3346978 RepID=UPI00364A8C3F
MTARFGEGFDTARAGSAIEALLARPLPAAGPVVSEDEPVTGEWAVTGGEGFLIAPLWESGDFTGLYAPEWNQAADAAEAHLSSLVRQLDRRWGPHRKVSMRVPLFRRLAGEAMPPLFHTLSHKDLLGDLAVWGPVTAGPDAAPRWVAVSLNQSDGDAPMIMIVVVTDRPITELEE